MATAPFVIQPPIEPMLAKLAAGLPPGDGFLFEPKWDGFRAIVFRGGGEVFIQSRDLRPLDRYFPELSAAFLAGVPDGAVLDGEIVIATPDGLNFDRLQMRLHPAASRVKRLADETPAAFVAFDAIAADGDDLREVPQRERRVRLERLLAGAAPPIHLTPMTRDRAQAAEWLSEFEGAGLDGVIAKPERWPLSAGEAGDDQGEARAHGGLCRRGVSMAQSRSRRPCRLAASGPVRQRATAASSRRRDLVVHDGGAA